MFTGTSVMFPERDTILDYSQGRTNRGSIWDTVSFSNPTARALYDHFHKTKECPYCHHPTKEVLSIYRSLDEFDDDSRSIRLWGCLNCGWWSQNRTNFELNGWSHEIRSVGILRTFDISDSQLPLAALKMELTKRPEILYDIHSKKFEQLVADVVGDYYDTEVTIIGRTNDGGIDLVYLQGDVPTAIQVKRRKRPDKVETVLLVREFLGALMLEGFTKGKIVTTASRFSKGSYRTKEKALRRGLVEQFELIDANRFYEMFRFHQQNNIRFPWQHIVTDWLHVWRDIPDAEIRVWEP